MEGEAIKASNVVLKTTLDTTFRAELSAADPIVSFVAIDPQRIDNAKRANASKIGKATQIGITQSSYPVITRWLGWFLTTTSLTKLAEA